jgi:hypothetical protein
MIKNNGCKPRKTVTPACNSAQAQPEKGYAPVRGTLAFMLRNQPETLTMK